MTTPEPRNRHLTINDVSQCQSRDWKDLLLSHRCVGDDWNEIAKVRCGYSLLSDADAGAIVDIIHSFLPDSAVVWVDGPCPDSFREPVGDKS
jgi:hypothetical protein